MTRPCVFKWRLLPVLPHRVCCAPLQIHHRLRLHTTPPPRLPPVLSNPSKVHEIRDEWKQIRPEDPPLTREDAHRLVQTCVAEDPFVYTEIRKALDKIIEPAFVDKAIILIYLTSQTLLKNRSWAPGAQKNFEDSLRFCNLPLDQAHLAAFQLMIFTANKRMMGAAHIGWDMMHYLSANGSVNTIIGLSLRYKHLLAINDLALFDWRGYERTREQLKNLAEAGDLQALTLEAQFMVYEDKPKESLPLWLSAIRLASERPLSKNTAESYLELEKPWLGLALLYKQEFDDSEVANATLQLGMLKDDPDAYGTYALWNPYTFGQDLYTYLEWINAATKAAASGHIPSTVSLAVHHAEHRPHEHLQSALRQDPWSSLTARFRPPGSTNAAQTVQAAEFTEYQQQVAAYAYNTRTPSERISHAIQWLSIAAEDNSVPALVTLAALQSRKFIFQAHNTSLPLKHPDSQTETDILSALQKNSSFSGSLADALDTEAAYFPSTADKPFRWRKGILNTFFAPEKAAACLEQVLDFAHARAAVLEQNAWTVPKMRKVAPDWYTNPDVADHNEATAEAHWRAAMDLAETMGWDDLRTRMDQAGMDLFKHPGERPKHPCKAKRLIPPDLSKIRKPVYTSLGRRRH